MSRKAKVNWGKVDWRLRDVDIARVTGCSRERVRQVRSAKGKPKSKLWHKRINTIQDKISGIDTSQMLPEKVARMMGCSPEYALQVLRSLGKKFVRPPDKRCRHKYAWDSVRKSEWNSMTDAQVAEKLGIPNPAVVTQWRRRKGIVKRGVPARVVREAV